MPEPLLKVDATIVSRRRILSIGHVAALPKVAKRLMTVRRATQKVAPQPGPEAQPPAKRKIHLVRDSFTMPSCDFDLIDALKARAIGFERPAKKSELLRAGLHALQALDDKALEAALRHLVPLKLGRSRKER